MNTKAIYYSFTPHNNGGEQLSFSTKTDGVSVVHEISLQSYSNSASFTITDEITPNQLRELADQLEDFYKQHADWMIF